MSMQGTFVDQCMPACQHQSLNQGLRKAFRLLGPASNREPTPGGPAHSVTKAGCTGRVHLTSFLLPPCPTSVSRTTHGLLCPLPHPPCPLPPLLRLWGDVVKWGSTNKANSATECCDRCREHVAGEDEFECNGEHRALRGRALVAATTSRCRCVGKGQGAHRWLPSQKVAAVLIRSSLVAIT